ncbi:MAG: BolA family transcriptional regulator [Candidatus Omnitrophica bacterium]|nr:BolA family transcriptional regulator [Candidatus Omnitrophota bacterium]
MAGGALIPTLEKMRARLSEALSPSFLDLVDETPFHAGHAGAEEGGGHYTLTVISSRFEGLSAVDRHRAVYAALGDLMKTEIHALSIKAYSPREWQAGASG